MKVTINQLAELEAAMAETAKVQDSAFIKTMEEAKYIVSFPNGSKEFYSAFPQSQYDRGLTVFEVSGSLTFVSK